MPQEPDKYKPYLVFDDQRAYGLVESPYKKAGFNELMAPQNELEENIYHGVFSSTVVTPRMSSVLTTKGDVWGYDTADNRIPVGTNFSVLLADSVQALGVRWSDRSWAPAVVRRRQFYDIQPEMRVNATVPQVEFNFVPNRPNVTGTTSNLSDSTGHYINYQSGAVSGNQAGWEDPAFNRMERQLKPICSFIFKTGASSTDIADVRIWVGYGSAAITGSATPAAHIAAFRYATAADGTAFWRTVTDNGSGSPTVTTTSLAIAHDTRYEFTIDCSNTSNVKFYSGVTLLATHTTTLPTSTQDLGHTLALQTTAAASKNIRPARIFCTFE